MDLIEVNLQKQIDKVKYEIRNCDLKDFDSLIDKYQVFNNIKNTFDEELVEAERFQKVLEEDQEILEKIYNKVQGLDLYSLPPTFDEVMLEVFLKEVEDEKKQNNVLASDMYKGIFYSVINDCDENKGGYYIEFFKVRDESIGDVDFDNRLDYMVIHAENEYEMQHSEEVVKSYIDTLLMELENENQEEL